MRGPEGVAADLAGALVAALPDKLDELVTRLALPELDADGRPTIPHPALITAQERDLTTLGLAEFPAIFVVVQEGTNLGRVDITDDAGIVYRYRYPVRLFLFVRGRTYEATDLLRKRYMLAIRELLLANQEALDLDETQGQRESYSDVGQVDASDARNLAGAWVAVTIETDETLAGPALRQAAPEDGWELVLVDELVAHDEAFDE